MGCEGSPTDGKVNRAPLKKQSGESEDAALHAQRLVVQRSYKDPNATPNTPQDARNKRNKKPWQDNNGYMHYPDGSASSGVVESS